MMTLCRSPPVTSCWMMHWRKASMFWKTARRMKPRFSALTTLFLWLESWRHLRRNLLLCLQILLRKC